MKTEARSDSRVAEALGAEIAEDLDLGDGACGPTLSRLVGLDELDDLIAQLNKPRVQAFTTEVELDDALDDVGLFDPGSMG